jgi:hypothetical protein
VLPTDVDEFILAFDALFDHGYNVGNFMGVDGCAPPSANTLGAVDED